MSAVTPALETDSVTRRRFGVAAAADRLGVTEGQLYTMVIGTMVGLITAAIGIPPTLRDHPQLRAALERGAPAVAAPSPGRTAPVVPSPAAVAPIATPQSAGVFTAPDSSFASGDTGSPAASGPAATTATYADGGKLGTTERAASVGAPGAPSGIAVDADGGFWVVTDNGGAARSAVMHYAASGALVRTFAVSGQPDGHTRGLTGIVLDGAGHAFVTDAATNRVLRIDTASGAQDEVATLPDVPACTTDQTAACEPSPVSGKPLAEAIATTASGDLLVADAGQGIVWKVNPFGGIAMWDKSSDYLSPDAGPSGLAVDRDGSVLLVVGKSLMAGLGGTIYRIAVDSAGAPSGHTGLAKTDPNSTPNGIAVGASGRIYVALTGVNRVAVYEKDGGTQAAAVIATTSMAKPFGLAFRGHSLLLTNEATAAGDDPSSWKVLRVAAEDTAAR